MEAQEIIERIMSQHWDMIACRCWVCTKSRELGYGARDAYLSCHSTLKVPRVDVDAGEVEQQTPSYPIEDLNADEIEKSYAEMKKASGDIKDTRPLVAFLYMLIRDKLTPSAIEEMIDEIKPHRDFEFTNGWLAAYAQDIAGRLGVSK